LFLLERQEVRFCSKVTTEHDLPKATAYLGSIIFLVIQQLPLQKQSKTRQLQN